MADITTIGELLIDLTQVGTNKIGVPQFSANPGGAPANVAVAARRLGITTSFVGKVGNDGYGRYLRSVLEANDVDISGLKTDISAHTTLAVVTVDDDGERDFSFYRENTADIRLSPTEIDLDPTKILHFGSVSLTSDPSRSAIFEAINQAKSMGSLISYDPNYRANLWDSKNDAITWMKYPLDQVDILKVSDEELILLTDTEDLIIGSEILSNYGIRLVLVTLGAEGSFFRYGSLTGKVDGYSVAVADTNGAGDTFLGAMLMQIIQHGGLSDLSTSILISMLDFSNKAASLTASRSGAIPAMPTLNEIL